jgi:hypothetical protein
VSACVCPSCGGPITTELALEVVAAAVLERPLSERRANRRAELWADVANYLARNPTASANAVAASVDGRRQDVLRAVRAVRRRLASVPEPRNHTHDRAHEGKP